MRSLKSSAAFTLIELLIVIAISAVFSTLAITYSNIGRNAAALSVAEAEMSQFIVQAKALSIATYTSGTGSCAYGMVIHVNTTPQTYSIFSYDPAGAPPCPPASSVTAIDPDDEAMYTDGTWDVPINQGVEINSPTDIAMLFYPPEPSVFLSSDGTDLASGSITVPLETVDGKNSVSISINPEGQVSL